MMSHLHQKLGIKNILTFHRSPYDNILLINDFKMTPNNSEIKCFIDEHELYNIRINMLQKYQSNLC